MKHGKPLILLLLSLLIAMPSRAATVNIDSVLSALDHVVERRDTYYVAHLWKIDSVKKELANVPEADYRLRAQILHEIFNRYKSFQGDSAIAVADREIELAAHIDDPDVRVRARADKLFSQISTANFTDAVDLVRSTDLRGVSPRMKGEFYFLCRRLFSDMSNFTDGTFSDNNAHLSHAYADSVIAVMPADSYEARYASIFKTLDDKSMPEKIGIFNRLMLRNDIDNSEKAMICAIIADLYLEDGDRNMGLFYKARSAIMDITESKRETSSLRVLAEMRFQDGDYDRASRYINAAMDDANYFNAPHRKAEIANVMPLIETQRYTSVNRERYILWWGVGALALLLLSLAAVFFFYIRAARRLSRTNRLLTERTAQLERANKELSEARENTETANARLRETLQKLSESVKIKDEYLGYGFYLNSEYIKKIESLYKLVGRKLKARQFDDLAATLRESDLRKEKEEMLHNFDSIFLRLFPTFIAQYNDLFPPEVVAETRAKADGDPDHTLTPEMRIFALIRLGVSDIAKIATFLNYSPNTVNTYKTRAKKASNLSNDRFEPAIMAIRSVD